MNSHLHSLEICMVNRISHYAEPISNDCGNQKPVDVCKRMLSINPVRIENYYFLFVSHDSYRVCENSKFHRFYFFPFASPKSEKKPSQELSWTIIALFHYYSLLFALQFETAEKKICLNRSRYFKLCVDWPTKLLRTSETSFIRNNNNILYSL